MHLSYKFRIPFSLMVSALLTALVLGLAISFATYRNIVEDRINEGTQLAHALTPVLTQALKHDDIWLAYNLLRGPTRDKSDTQYRNSNILIVTDEHGRIFASNRPRVYGVGKPVAEHAGLYRELFRQTRSDTASQTVRRKMDDQLVLARGLYSQGAYRGALLIIYPVQTFWNRFYEIIRSGLWVMLFVLIPLVILGWYWGRYMVAPLIQLSHCMARLRSGEVRQLECKVYEGQDEIGELGKQFKKMLQGLKQKQLLEEKMMSQERLAAIGRLTASVAHEINSPVGGMLVALDTWRNRPADERDADKLLDLLERGLNQIRETVSALLVEARIENRQLEPHDIEDIRTLLAAQALPPGARLHWSSQIGQKLDVTASAVRQILMNLVTNAIQAIGPDEEVFVNIDTIDGTLCIDVSDTGRPIPSEEQTHLFEPFQTYREDGTGLGLWITYQIVEQLQGSIEVHSDELITRFSVKIPVMESTANSQLEYCD